MSKAFFVIIGFVLVVLGALAYLLLNVPSESTGGMVKVVVILLVSTGWVMFLIGIAPRPRLGEVKPDSVAPDPKKILAGKAFAMAMRVHTNLVLVETSWSGHECGVSFICCICSCRSLNVVGKVTALIHAKTGEVTFYEISFAEKTSVAYKPEEVERWCPSVIATG